MVMWCDVPLEALEGFVGSDGAHSPRRTGRSGPRPGFDILSLRQRLLNQEEEEPEEEYEEDLDDEDLDEDEDEDEEFDDDLDEDLDEDEDEEYDDDYEEGDDEEGKW